MGMSYLEIPVKVVKELGGKFKARVVCTVNGKLSFQAGIVALGEGKGYISITRKRLKELGVEHGQRVEVELKRDSSKFGMSMPEELAELLKQDDEGRRRFEKLTPGRQRYIIGYVNGVKNPELRLERAMLLIGNLKRLPEGKEQFRQMLGKS
jgi:hypothetical protein